MPAGVNYVQLSIFLRNEKRYQGISWWTRNPKKYHTVISAKCKNRCPWGERIWKVNTAKNNGWIR